jgi:beta-aspartyl-peptidase (threonine type)
LIAASVLMKMSTAAAETDAASSRPVTWAIALHGGAGARSPDMSPAERDQLERGLRDALSAGQKILAAGGTALDAVEATVVALEDHPSFNAGRGAVFTRTGGHELDASIMDGATLRTGAVAGVKHVKNPVKAARLVMSATPHILLGGEAADTFAAQHGCDVVEQSYYYTKARFDALQSALAKEGSPPLASPAYPQPFSENDGAKPGSPADTDKNDDAGGTVGCVALDPHGNLAVATSTGGLTGKMAGRIGDTPLCGAGYYASNAHCAVSGTGKGEEFIRHTIAARMALLVSQRGMTIDDAAQDCLANALQPGDGGLIAIDRAGHVVMPFTTPSMPRGVADSTGRFEIAIWPDAP